VSFRGLRTSSFRRSERQELSQHVLYADHEEKAMTDGIEINMLHTPNLPPESSQRFTNLITAPVGIFLEFLKTYTRRREVFPSFGRANSQHSTCPKSFMPPSLLAGILGPSALRTPAYRHVHE
jgi:hypothetical protein